MPGSPSLTFFTKNLEPWQPDIDARHSEKPRIITGSNFRDELDGPRSAFASKFVNLNYWDADTRKKVNSFNIPNDVLYGTPTGIWKINNSTGLAEWLLPQITVDDYWPWTFAYVGGYYYIAQYDIGLWQYDPVAETITLIDTPAGLKVRGITESFGRLIYITDTVVATSALDDGTDLTPNLASAAGGQTLSLVGGVAYSLEDIPDGFIVYMSEGLLKGTFTQEAFVFSYDNLTNAVKTFSPNATVYVPNLGIISVDPTGLNLTREDNYQDRGKPQPWEIEKSDYIKNNIIFYMNQSLKGTICLYYSLSMQLLFLCFSSNTLEGVMNVSFVYSMVSKRWGSFNQSHTGIFETYNTINNIFTTTYMGVDGYMHAFDNTDFTQGLPDDTDGIIDYLYRPAQADEVVRIYDVGTGAVQVVTTDINGSDNNPNAYKNYSLSGLFYINYQPYSDTANNDEADPEPDVSGSPLIFGTYINMDTSGALELFALPYELPRVSLNSFLQVGPFRFTDQVQADETSLVSTIILAMNATANFVITEDWNELTGSEDWNTASGDEDWGIGNSVPSNYQLLLNDTNDGVNTPIQGLEELPVFQDLGSSQVFMPMGYSSIYHTLTLNALEAGQSFALKVIDFTGILTGRLTTA